MLPDLLNIFNSSPDLYLVLSPDYKIEAVTDAYLKATFRKRDAILQKNIFDIFADELYGSTGIVNLKTSLDEVSSNKLAHQIRVEGYEIDHSGYVNYKKKYWQFINVPVLDDNQDLKHIIMKVGDITSIVEEEREVERSHECITEEAERLKEAQTVGCIGSFDWKYPLDYLQLSDELYRIYGLTPTHEKLSIEKLLSHTFLEDVPLFKAAIDNIIQNQQPFDLIIRIVKQDNVIRYTRFIAKAQKKNDFLRIFGTVQDITEQILSQQKVICSEAMLKRAEALGKMGSYEADLDAMTFLFSDNLYRMLGYEPGTFEPNLELIDSISHPDDIQKVREILQEVRITKKPYHYFQRVYKPNGQMVHLSCHGCFVQADKSKIEKFVCTIQDITNHIKTDLILNTMNEVCFELDHELKIIYANKPACKFWNRSLAEILETQVSTVYPEGLNSEFFKIINDALHTSKPVVKELWLPLESKWVLLNVNPSATGLIVLHVDITEQKKANEEINQQRQHFKSLVENIPDVVTRWDTSLNLLYSNKAVNASNKLFVGSIIGETSLQMAMQKNIVPWQEKFYEAVETKQPKELLFTTETAEGKSYFISRLVPEIDENGTVKSVLSISRDVTQLKEAENRLKENHELLMSIFNASPNSICLFKTIYSGQHEVEDFEIIMLNDLTETIIDDVSPIGKRYSQLFPKIIETGIFDEFKKTAITGEPANFEKYYNGEDIKRWFHFRVTRLRDMIIVSTEDITARKQIEEQVKNSNDLLQSIFNSSILALNVYKAIRNSSGEIIDFRILMMSDLSKEMLQLEDSKSENLLEVMPWIQRDSLFEELKEIVNENKVLDHHDRVTEVGDEVKWIWRRGVKLGDGMVTSWLDITEKKQTELKLQEANLFIQHITDSIPDIIYVYDLDKKEIVYVNKESVGSVEYLKDYIYNLSPNVSNVIIHESDAEKRILHNLNLKSLTENESREVDFRIKGPDNDWKWFRVRDSLLKKNENGSASQILGLCQNITKQKLAEEELIKNYEILKQAEEVASSGSWEFDLRQDKMHWSDGMYELFQLDHHTKPFLELFLEYVVSKDRYNMREFIHKIRSGSNLQEEEITIMVAGTPKTIRLKAATINDDDGEPVKVLGVGIDVTAKRATEIKLQILEEQRQAEILDVVMEAQEEERRRIAETLHNEFGQLLTAAKFKIRTNTTEAISLINTAITSVKTISYELMPPILQDFGLKTALNDLFQVRFADANIHYVAIITGLEERLYRVHELAIFRVIQEITNNIVKHSKASQVTIDIQRRAQIISIDIADNGSGLDLKKSSEFKNNFGLRYITNRIQLLKGKVQINSKKNSGTQFVIELPLM
ncbi:MAG: hypothetical protein JWQ25_1640 [Daejeonella sp.]|nr:hypothetical protein [Daejeonella sp.]